MKALLAILALSLNGCADFKQWLATHEVSVIGRLEYGEAALQGEVKSRPWTGKQTVRSMK
jgi:hypothetical protein